MILSCCWIIQRVPISFFQVFYLDDRTWGGPLADVVSSLKFLMESSRNLGLVLNTTKCEIICADVTTESSMLTEFPSLLSTSPYNASLLGSPIGDLSSINSVLESKIQCLTTIGNRLEAIQTHDALVLLRHAFTIPKILYVLRTAPCFTSRLSDAFDSIQRSLLESICNLRLDNSLWLQASLYQSILGGSGLEVQLCVHLQLTLLQLLAALHSWV